MLIPNWPAPPNVKSTTFLAHEPVTASPQYLLKQVHGNTVVTLPAAFSLSLEGDAAITRTAGVVCAIKTADCLPILVANKQGNEIAAIHAGWRGLVAGVIEATFTKLASPAGNCMAWIGPGICIHCFEVGEEVKQAFVTKSPVFKIAFKQSKTPYKYFANLSLIAELILQSLGVNSIVQSNICTFENVDYASYRREPDTKDRLISTIWFN